MEKTEKEIWIASPEPRHKDSRIAEKRDLGSVSDLAHSQLHCLIDGFGSRRIAREFLINTFPQGSLSYGGLPANLLVLDKAYCARISSIRCGDRTRQALSSSLVSELAFASSR
jgi:hypothetical protein